MKRFLRLVPVVALLGAAPLTSACSKPADHPDLEARVNDQLKAGKLDDSIATRRTSTPRPESVRGWTGSATSRAFRNNSRSRVTGERRRASVRCRIRAVSCRPQ